MPDNAFLQGIFEPVQMECDAPDLIVEGEIPADLNGSFYRNGPNPHYPPRGDHHLFGGDGMTHAFHIGEGKVGYTNRWIRTAKFKLESDLQRSAINPMNPFDSEEQYVEFVLTDKEGLANTACVWHNGKLLILEEGHLPYQVDPVTLASIGSYDFAGKLSTAMTAHPKIDPVTGELIFFAYMSQGPFEADVSLYKVNSDGVLTESHLIQTPYPAMVHDFVVTRNYILFPIFPLTGSLERAMQGQPPFAWEPDKGSSVGVLPRNGSADDVRWVDCDNIFAFHYMNGYDQDGVITSHQCQFAHPPLFPRADGEITDDAKPFLSRWTIDMNDPSSSVEHELIDDNQSEFPQVDPRYAMSEYRYGFYATPGAGTTGASGMYNGVGRYDHVSGSTECYAFGDADSAATSEPIFVPRSADAREGEGYLLAVATDTNANRSRLVILDAENLSDGPLATAYLNHKVPVGFHGGWKPAG
jgi:carotenoid cleavage dioxygenase